MLNVNFNILSYNALNNALQGVLLSELFPLFLLKSMLLKCHFLYSQTE